MKRRVFLLATLALVGVLAFAAGSVASAKPALAGSAAGATRASCYADAVGDAGEDLAPGEGLAAYPGGPSSRCGYASLAPTLPARWSAPRTTP